MIVDKIRAKCFEKGISVTELERAVGLGNGVVGKWSNRSPTVANIKKVADYFGCSVDELLRED